MQSQGGIPSPIKRAQFHLHNTSIRDISLARQIPDVYHLGFFQGPAPPTKRPTLFFPSCVASCRACALPDSHRSDAARDLSQNRQSKTTTSFFLLWRRNSISGYSMPLPAFGLAVRRATRLLFAIWVHPLPDPTLVCLCASLSLLDYYTISIRADISNKRVVSDRCRGNSSSHGMVPRKGRGSLVGQRLGHGGVIV
jgi:hypothetical protein